MDNIWQNVPRKRCKTCNLMTTKWQRINGGPVHCFDGCIRPQVTIIAQSMVLLVGCRERKCLMYTVTCDYFATGEGRTFMLLITRGYGKNDDGRENALDTFKELFGDYFAIAAEVKQGIDFEFSGSNYLLSDALRDNIMEWEKTAGGLEYHASLHVNFS